jgi:hypothetical protein
MKGKKTVKNEASVTRGVSAIQVGNDTYQVAPTKDGRGIDVRNANGQIFIPVGNAGQLLGREILSLTKVQAVTKAKRKRRTKEQIEAANANVPVE